MPYQTPDGTISTRSSSQTQGRREGDDILKVVKGKKQTVHQECLTQRSFKNEEEIATFPASHGMVCQCFSLPQMAEDGSSTTLKVVLESHASETALTI